MANKEDILEAWIMSEHLSEGDLKKGDAVTDIDDIDGKFYEHIQGVISSNLEKAKTVSEKCGVVVYFDIFEFSEAVEMLRRKYELPQSLHKPLAFSTPPMWTAKPLWDNV